MANTLAIIVSRTAIRLPKNFLGLAASCISDLQGKLKMCSTSLKPLLMCMFLAVRTLYSPAALGVDGFVAHKQNIKNQFANISEKFVTKMKEFTSDDTKGMVFTEDLKNMIHLAETDEDIELVVKMMKRSVLVNSCFSTFDYRVTYSPRASEPSV